MTEKQIAFKVIQQLSTCKYFQGWQIVTLIKRYTEEPRLIKNSYNQVRRALTKLGYTN